MDYSESKIPEFKCHKAVRAFKIQKIETVDRATVLAGHKEMHVVVGEQYMAKHKPQVGGYYVLYKDDYESYSPAKAFEEGYTLYSEGDDQYPWRNGNRVFN